MLTDERSKLIIECQIVCLEGDRDLQVGDTSLVIEGVQCLNPGHLVRHWYVRRWEMAQFALNVDRGQVLSLLLLKLIKVLEDSCAVELHVRLVLSNDALVLGNLNLLHGLRGLLVVLLVLTDHFARPVVKMLIDLEELEHAKMHAILRFICLVELLLGSLDIRVLVRISQRGASGSFVFFASLNSVAALESDDDLEKFEIFFEGEQTADLWFTVDCDRRFAHLSQLLVLLGRELHLLLVRILLILLLLLAAYHDEGFLRLDIFIIIEVIFLHSTIKCGKLDAMLDVNLIKNLLASVMNELLGLISAHRAHLTQFLLRFEVHLDPLDDELLGPLARKQLLALRVDFKSDCL